MSGFLRWMDDRFPFTKVWKEHVAEYYTPKNFNFFYLLYFFYFASESLIFDSSSLDFEVK